MSAGGSEFRKWRLCVELRAVALEMLMMDTCGLADAAACVGASFPALRVAGLADDSCADVTCVAVACTVSPATVAPLDEGVVAVAALARCLGLSSATPGDDTDGSCTTDTTGLCCSTTVYLESVAVESGGLAAGSRRQNVGVRSCDTITGDIMRPLPAVASKLTGFVAPCVCWLVRLSPCFDTATGITLGTADAATIPCCRPVWL